MKPRHVRHGLARWWWPLALLAFPAALAIVVAPVSAQTLSSDATLRNLTLSEGRLSPAFDSATTTYLAAVGYTIPRITVSPVTNDASATVAYTDGADQPLTDADSAAGQQVDLAVGENVIKVKVTAEDGNATETYTITVTRTEEDTSLSPTASDATAAFPSSAVYRVTFTGAWDTTVTPDGLPGRAHFSPLVGAVHSARVAFLESGEMASAGIESMAEVGATSALEGEVDTAINADPPTALSVLSRSRDIGTMGTATLSNVALTTDHPRVTLTTMIAPSHDWFVGVSGLSLLDASGHWLRSHEVELFPWDAGTEEGTDFSLSPSVATSPQGTIESIRGTGKFTTERIASLSFTLQSVSATRSVAENTAASVDIGAPVTLPGVGTATYALGGTDAASFEVVPSTGQLQTKAALDYETRSGYEVTVTATDTDGSVTTTVAIEVTNVIELAAITGPATVTFAENGAGRVATYTASSEGDQHGIDWIVAGTDATHFTIDTPGGALRFHIDPIAPNIFPKLPDFESPDDDDTDNEYSISLLAQVGANVSAAFTVTVTVTDVDEEGGLSLSSTRPALGAALRAVLSDPDGVTAGTALWQWERSTGRNAWAVIDGAASASYTPVAADTNTFLRVTATYADEHETGKTVGEVAPNVVTGPLLTGLTAETDDSQADTARGLYPAFDPLTLHYGIGCTSTDTLVLTVSAAVNARVAVAGVQAASAPMAVDVSEHSDVAIRVTDASGAGTTYVVHCLPEVFFEIETHTFPNTDAFEDLILFNRASYLRLIDRNGVPRLHLGFAGANTFAVRFHPVGADGAYRYGFQAESRSYIILDEDFEVLADNVRTVTPLTSTDTHDFQILEDGNYLLMSYEPATRDFSDIDLPYLDGASVSSVDVEDAAFQIVTPGRHAVFTWNSWGNMAIEDCAQHRFPVTLSTDPDMRSPDPDYAHINGMHVVDGVLVASIRGCSKVLGIDVEPGATRGDVLWRMGRTNLSDEEWSARDIGPRPLDFINDPAGEFCGQHAARILPNGNVFLFDNGSVCVIDPWTFEQLGREGSDFSRAVEYALDLENHEAVFVRDHSLRGMRDYLGYANGTVFALDNGDWLVSWGRPLDVNVPIPDNEMATLVDPDTGQEKLGLRFRELPSNVRWRRINATVAPAEVLAPQPVPLSAEFPASEHTSLFHTGSGDAPQVIVAFNQPVVDFSAASPSISVQGGTVESVSAHVVAGEPANAYLVTLTPDGAGAITFRLVTGQACASGGICTVDATRLSDVPGALVIGLPVTVSFGQAAYSVREGATISVPVRLSAAHRGGRGITVPVIVSAGSTASADDFSVTGNVTFGAGQTQQTVSLEASDDALIEGPEIVILAFGPLPPGVTEGNVATTDITINDADTADIRFTAPVSEVAEGGEVSLNVTIDNGVTFAADQTITLAIGGTVDTSDFYLRDNHGLTLAAPYAITLPARASSVQARLGAVDDTQIESASETVTIAATLAGTNRSLGVQTIAIPASDVPDTPTVTISPGASVTEGADATFTLFRTDAPNHPLTSALTVRLQVTATGSTLSGATPSTTTFDAGSTTATVQVTTLDDRVVEPPGTVTALVLGSRSNPPVYLTGVTNVATVAVNDNDVAAFTLEASAEEVAEGGAVTVTITVDNVTFAEPQAIALTLGGMATHGDDFILAGPDGVLSDPYTVTLPTGATSVRITVRTARDDEDDAGETVELSASHEGNPIGTVAVRITTPSPSIPFIPGGGGGGGGGGGFGGGGGGGATGPTPSDVDFEWTVKHDIDELDGGHDTPSGLWSDGTTLWALENGDGADDAIYAYDLKSGERVEEREFELDARNRAPRGLWSDRTIIWVADSGRNRLFAHNLESGERLPEREIELAERNSDARGIWSNEETMWVLDGGKDALFAYDLATGDSLAEYALDSTNGDPRGIWSDGVTFWVSDHGEKRLFAYRLEAGEDGEAELGRNRDEEFPNTTLSRASNNSPRGIWSDGDVMYVADESDDKVYTYNMPDALDARLASLTLSGVDIGEFDPDTTDYEGSVADGVTETTVVAEAMQGRTDVAIDPPDADPDTAGHQVALQGVEEITVTVTSADGSRTKTYRVAFKQAVAEITLNAGWNTFAWPGVDGVAIADVLRGDGDLANDISATVAALYGWDEESRSWLGYFPGLEDVPGLNTLTSFSTGAPYWVAVSDPATWIVPAVITP